MSNRLERGIRASVSSRPRIRNDTTVATLQAAGYPATAAALQDTTATAAMKLSAVDRCIEVLSDSLGKLPIYVMERDTRKRVDPPLNEILTLRPNEAQTPTVAKKLMEAKEKLAAVKDYMRINVDEDDAIIKALYCAAALYLKNAGIEEPPEDPSLYNLAVWSLTLH